MLIANFYKEQYECLRSKFLRAYGVIKEDVEVSFEKMQKINCILEDFNWMMDHELVTLQS